MVKEDIQYKVAEALDNLRGVEAQVAHRRFLGGHTYEQISGDLDISTQDAAQIAALGLRRIRRHVFDNQKGS